MDAFLLAAMKEADEMLPGTPRITPYELTAAEVDSCFPWSPPKDINGFIWNDCTCQWIHPSGRKVSGVEVDFHGPAILWNIR